MAGNIEPLKDICIAVVKVSQTCWQLTEPMLKFEDSKDRQLSGFGVFCEYLYFFMHLTCRTAFQLRLTEQQIESLQAYLGPVIASTAIDSFVGHWPADVKEKVLADFYSKLNDAEIEYSRCKEVFDGKFLGESLFMKLAWNIAELSGNPMNPATIALVVSFAIDEYKAMSLDTLVLQAGKVL